MPKQIIVTLKNEFKPVDILKIQVVISRALQKAGVNLFLMDDQELEKEYSDMCGECWLNSGPDNSPKCKCLTK